MLITIFLLLFFVVICVPSCVLCFGYYSFICVLMGTVVQVGIHGLLELAPRLFWLSKFIHEKLVIILVDFPLYFTIQFSFATFIFFLCSLNFLFLISYAVGSLFSGLVYLVYNVSFCICVGILVKFGDVFLYNIFEDLVYAIDMILFFKYAYN